MEPKLLKVQQYLEASSREAVGMPPSVISEAATDLVQVLNKAFNKLPRDRTRVGMSGLGRPLCQLQLEKIEGVKEVPLSSSNVMNFLLGDTVEIIFKAILKASLQEGYEEGKRCKLEIGKYEVFGTSDCSTEGEVEDIKSASDWAFNHKFSDFDSLNKGDAFGYVSQLVLYGKAQDKKLGGWWAVNKQNGDITYLRFDESKVNVADRVKELEEKLRALEEGDEFKPLYSDEPETFYKKDTGRRRIPKDSPCRMCKFRYHCHPNLQEVPNKESKAKKPPLELYTKVLDGE